jgi:hypothetical protein
MLVVVISPSVNWASGPLFVQFRISFTQGWFVPNWPASSGEDFKKIFSVFLLFCYYLPLGWGTVLHSNNLESPPHKDLCQVWLKLALWFWRSWKCKSLQTDNGRSEKLTWAFYSGELKCKNRVVGSLKIFSSKATGPKKLRFTWKLPDIVQIQACSNHSSQGFGGKTIFTPPPKKKIFKNLFQNHVANFNQTWYKSFFILAWRELKFVQIKCQILFKEVIVTKCNKNISKTDGCSPNCI